jgi:alanyl-tRNA synthetase
MRNDENLTNIVEVRDLKGKRCIISLAHMPYHPAGGGQPGDSGTLEGEEFLGDVRDCLLVDGRKFLDVHIIKGVPKVGMKVKASVDEERHRVLSRMHTGEHILSRVLETEIEGLRVNKVNISEEESSIYLSYDGNLDWEKLFSAEEKANEIIQKDLPVYVKNLTKEEAKAMKDLKINIDRIKGDTVRVVVVPEFDLIACSGSHVGSTLEVGGIFVTGFNGSPPNWSVSFTVHVDKYLQNYSKAVRKLMRKIGCPLDKLESVFASLQEERKNLSNAMDKARKYICLPWEKDSFGDADFYYALVEGALADMCSPAVKKKVLESPKSIVLCLFKDQASEGSARFIMARGESCNIDVRDFLKGSPTLKAKGGGASNWVQGITECVSMKEWRIALQKYYKI